jgi:hypothetical protein
MHAEVASLIYGGVNTAARYQVVRWSETVIAGSGSSGPVRRHFDCEFRPSVQHSQIGQRAVRWMQSDQPPGR